VHIDAEIWTDMCTDVPASEWRPLTDRTDAEHIHDCITFQEFIDLDGETWRWKDSCRCQQRHYHIFEHYDRYYGVLQETIIFRRIGPDLHVDMSIAEQQDRMPRLKFTYTLSGNLIWEQELDTATRLLPPDFDIDIFLKQKLGLTGQQHICLHFEPALEELFLQPEMSETSYFV
jgi:hypothetical protein